MITQTLCHSGTKPSTAKLMLTKEKRGIAKVVIEIYAKQNEIGKEKTAPQSQPQKATATKTLHPETSMNSLTIYAVQPTKQTKPAPSYNSFFKECS